MSAGAMHWVRRRAAPPSMSRDAGNAVVEFLGVSLLLLVPVVYLVLVLGALQAGAFAVDGAAREAVRAFVTAPDDVAGSESAVAAVALALDDQGLDPGRAAEALTLTCAAQPCRTPGGAVTASVEVAIELPGVPGWLKAAVPLAIPVSAQATATIDDFVAGG